MRLVILEPIGDGDLVRILERAVADTERGLGESGIRAADGALALIAERASGDGRAALNLLELCARAVGRKKKAERVVDPALVVRAAERQTLGHDKGGESHFNVISALHKSIRASDPDGALYWLARLLEGGDDPVYVARRLVRVASEDIGLADPRALVQANAAADAVRLVGLPEADLALAQATVYLALAPKSNALYVAYAEVRRDVRERRTFQVPLYLRNAPTKLMTEAGYGEGYVYAHDEPEAVGTQPCLPRELHGRRYYEPTDRGVEARLRERLRWFDEVRGRARRDASAEGAGP